MKHIALLTVALSALAITGCNSTAVNHAKEKMHIGKKHGEKGEKGEKRGERKHGDAMSYQCEKNATVSAKYGDNDTALLNITAPSLGLNNQNIELVQATSGSGNRYVNDKNPASVYEWQTTRGEGVLTVTVNKQDYSLVCEAQKP